MSTVANLLQSRRFFTCRSSIRSQEPLALALGAGADGIHHRPKGFRKRAVAMNAVSRQTWSTINVCCFLLDRHRGGAGAARLLLNILRAARPQVQLYTQVVYLATLDCGLA